MSVRILQGDCREVLRTLDSNSVQMVCTSPPYYGLRDYGVSPLVWGQTCCDHTHEWDAEGPSFYPGQVAQTKWQNVDAVAEGGRAGSGQRCKHVHEWTDATWTNSRLNDDTAGLKQRTNSGALDHDRRIRPGAECQCGAWLGSLGLEPDSYAYVSHIVECFREVRRVLHPSGIAFVNIGDSYSGSGKGPTGHNGIGNQSERQGFVDQKSSGAKPKDLLGIPWMVAFALRADGWWLRSDIIWDKKNGMPESVRDRPTRSHEYVFLLAKSQHYFYDDYAVREPNGNKRSVWRIATLPYSAAHFATMAPELAETCILAGSSEKGQCPTCRAPWERVVEHTEANNERNRAKDEPRDYLPAKGGNGSGISSLSGATYQSQRRVTSDWKPTCRHTDQAPVPQTILDPFSGAGTTVLVADRLGRDGLGIDLKPEYTDIAELRVINDGPMFANVTKESLISESLAVSDAIVDPATGEVFETLPLF